jgi:hypothetical protein
VKKTRTLTEISLPELALIAGTRAFIGAGIGLLLADRLSANQRKAVGWTILVAGAAVTIPLALDVFAGRTKTKEDEKASNLKLQSVA